MPWYLPADTRKIGAKCVPRTRSFISGLCTTVDGSTEVSVGDGAKQVSAVGDRDQPEHQHGDNRIEHVEAAEQLALFVNYGHEREALQ